MAIAASPPSAETRSTIWSSRYALQSQSTLPALLLTSSARWPIAKRGVQPMPRMPWSSLMSASCSSRNSSSVSQAWPVSCGMY